MRNKKLKKHTFIGLIGLLIMVLLAAGCENSKDVAADKNKLFVVTTSTDIADIVKEVGGDKVTVESIVPPGQCPGHFDIKPQTIDILRKANLFLQHDYEEEGLGNKLIESVENKDMTVVTLGENATYMMPSMRVLGIDEVVTALVKADPQNDETYKTAAKKLKEETNQIAAEQKKRLQTSKATEIKVIAALYQTGLAKWAGFDVIGSYSPDISLNETKKLIDLGRQEGVSLVIDNLQTPDKAGESISKELDIHLVTLSNFPGGLPGTSKWDDSFAKNVDLILEQLEKS